MKNRISDILSLSGVQGVNLILPLVVIPFLILKLGIDGYGRYAFAFAFANYLSLIVDFGYNLSNVQRISVVSECLVSKSKIFCSTVISKVFIFGISTAIFIPLLLLTDIFRFYQEIAVVYVIVLSNIFNPIYFFQAIGRIKIYSFINLSSRIITIPILFIFVREQGDILVALGVMSSSYLIVSVFSLYYLFRTKQLTVIVVSRSEIVRGLKYSWPVFLSNSSIGIYTQLMVIFLGVHTSPVAVGIYSFLTKLSSSVYAIFFYPISQIYLPVVSKAFKASYDQGLNYLGILQKRVITYMGIIVGFYFFLGRYLLVFLGPEMATAKVEFYLRILAFVPFFMAFGASYGLLGLLAIGSKLSIKMFRDSYLIAGIVALLVGAILITCYGLDGAVCAIVSVEIIVALSLFLKFRLYKKTIKS
ncbi:oligosaccharide flippase family protein [Akkermansiaceae bacterium]|nr:oligosaccharide flippase family protein [Akkermansiaceae bacterium]